MSVSASRPLRTTAVARHNAKDGLDAAEDGRYIFIDVGGNVGDSLATWFAVGAPGIPKPAREFDTVILFEPNQEYASKFDRFRRMKMNFTFIAAAAADKDGTTTFSGTGLGGALIDGGDAVAVASGVQVRTIDFSGWLAQTVQPDDYVVCKIDAEGSEYDIVRRMFADGTLCLCDRLSIEWHGWLGHPTAGTHLRSYLDPDSLSDRFDDHPACADGRCFCHIPHLQRVLPHAHCGLARTVQWARKACNFDAAVPLLEHHERWPGWDAVGTAAAFEKYDRVSAEQSQ